MVNEKTRLIKSNSGQFLSNQIKLNENVIFIKNFIKGFFAIILFSNDLMLLINCKKVVR